MAEDLPEATPDQERYALERVGPVWRTMPPDEWVARNIHTSPLWGWASYRFRDAEFNGWMREAERYVFDHEGRRALRERYLTPAEIAAAEADEREL